MNPKSNNDHKQEEIIYLLDFLIVNLFAQFGGLVCQHTIGIPIVTY